MKRGWELTRLGGVCEFEKAPHRSGAAQYVGLEDIESGSGKFLGRSVPVAVKSNTFKFTREHLLYGRLRPYLNKVLLPDFEGHCSTEIFPIRLSKRLDRKFLFYWITREALVRQINATCTGARMPRANMKVVLEFAFLLPPLPEQRRIVSILDEAFAVLDVTHANAEKNLENARELFDGTVDLIFSRSTSSWKTESLQTLLESGWITSHLDGNHGSDYPRKEEFIKEGVPYISANCIEDGVVNLGLAKHLSPMRADKIRKGVAQHRDVLFAHNATVGPVAVLDTKEPRVVLGTSLTYYRCNPNHIAPEYLAHYMRSPTFKFQYNAVMRQSTRNQVPITKQREFTHVLPPIEVQREIATELDELSDNCRRVSDTYLRKLALVAEFKQSILEKAFAGELSTQPSTAVEAVA